MGTGTKIKTIILSTLLYLSTLSVVHAATWQITPRISGDEVYSDNINTVNIEEDDSLISLLSTGLELEYSAAVSSFSADYQLTRAWYSHDHQLDNNFNELSASGRLQLFPDGLSLTFGSSISNVSRSNARNANADIISGDTVEYKNHFAGLEYKSSNNSFNVDSEIIFSKAEAEDDIGEREGYNATFTSTNGNNSRYIFWDIDGQYNDYDDDQKSGRFYSFDAKFGYISHYKINPFIRYYDEDTSGNVSTKNVQGSSSIGAGVRWQVMNSLVLDVTYNWVDEQKEQEQQDNDDYLSASISWTPSDRAKLSARVYRRFFGDAYEFDLSHRLKRISTKVTYTEELDIFDRFELEQGVPQEIWCLAAAPQDTDSCIIQPGAGANLEDYFLTGSTTPLVPVETDEFTLNKSLLASVSFTGNRSTITVTTSRTRRENLEIEDYDTYDLFSLSLSRQTSRNTALDIKMSLNKNLFDNDNPLTLMQRDYYRTYSISFLHALNQKLNLTYSVQHLNRNSNRQYTYEENRASIKLVKEF
ncbi:hypothetical protein ND16A_1147 [Thalassotalea sp. ND16A]|nr:hypothetical protein ND16A_1147 [Thalassotalea sp. ND16A]